MTKLRTYNAQEGLRICAGKYRHHSHSGAHIGSRSNTDPLGGKVVEQEARSV